MSTISDISSSIPASNSGWLIGLSTLVGAFLSIADLSIAVQTNIEYNATEDEINHFNKTMSDTAITIRKIKSHAKELYSLCEHNFLRKKEKIELLYHQAIVIKDECFVRSSDLALCARMCQTRGKTKALSFCYRIRWGILMLAVGLALHLTPLALTGVPTVVSIVLITAAAGALSVPSLAHIISVCKQVKEELKELKGSEVELNTLADLVDKASKQLQDLSEKYGTASDFIQDGKEWDTLRKLTEEIDKSCTEAMNYSARIPVLTKKSFCVIS